MNRPFAVSAIEVARSGLMFLRCRENRLAVKAGEMNGQFGLVHSISMVVQGHSVMRSLRWISLNLYTFGRDLPLG